MSEKYFYTILVFAGLFIIGITPYLRKYRRNESRNELIKTATDTGMLIYQNALIDCVKANKSKIKQIDSAYVFKRDSIYKHILR